MNSLFDVIKLLKERGFLYFTGHIDNSTNKVYFSFSTGFDGRGNVINIVLISNHSYEIEFNINGISKILSGYTNYTLYKDIEENVHIVEIEE